MLKHRKRRIQQDKAVLEQKRQDRVKRVQKKRSHHNFKRAEAFVMGYLKAERTSKRIRQIILRKNITQQSEQAADETNPKLLLVMRHAGKKIFDKTTSDIFKTLGMQQRHNAVFLENNKENQLLLRVIEPFVVYGFPSLTTIRELLFKKGFARINGKKTAIQSNTMVEENLGDKGVICLEDIIHEIYTVGPNFAAVNKFLCSFTVSGIQEKPSIEILCLNPFLLADVESTRWLEEKGIRSVQAWRRVWRSWRWH